MRSFLICALHQVLLGW